MYRHKMNIDDLLLLCEIEIINGSNTRHLECYIVVKLTNKPLYSDKGLSAALRCFVFFFTLLYLSSPDIA